METNRTVMFCVAHSATNVGSRNDDLLLQEYMVSLRASLAAVRSLAGIVPVEFFDVGPIANQSEYLQAKAAKINSCKPSLAIELHCNSDKSGRASYGEVIHYPGSEIGHAAGTAIATAIATGLKLTHKKDWQQRGARANSVEKDKHMFYLLTETRVPVLIVEGFFISNHDQARWLVEGGQEAYGVMVADGVRDYIKGLA